MATANMISAVEQIGETAGLVWSHLNENGSVSLTKLVKEVEAPRDLIMQALGWLCEDKVSIDESSRSKTVSLR